MSQHIKRLSKCLSFGAPLPKLRFKPVCFDKVQNFITDFLPSSNLFSKPLELAAKKFRRKFQMNEMLPEERQIVETLNPWLKLSLCDRDWH